MSPDTLRIYRSPLTTQWRWRLTARNGRIIGASTESYVRRVDCIANAARVLDIPERAISAVEAIGLPAARRASPPVKVSQP